MPKHRLLEVVRGVVVRLWTSTVLRVTVGTSSQPYDVQLGEWKSSRVVARLPEVYAFMIGTIKAVRNNKDVQIVFEDATVDFWVLTWNCKELTVFAILLNHRNNHVMLTVWFLVRLKQDRNLSNYHTYVMRCSYFLVNSNFWL